MTAPDSTVDAARQLTRTRDEAHPFCFACSCANPLGLAVSCVVGPDGGVSASFLPHGVLEGYPGVLHGGLVATLLDAVMTQCLFARGIRAMTADLSVRYRLPVLVAEEVTVRAWPESDRHGLFTLQGQIVQEGRVKVRARARFIERPDHAAEP